MPNRKRSETGAGFDPPRVVGTYHHDLTTGLVFASEGLAGFFNIDPARASRGQPLSVYLDALVAEDRCVLEAAVELSRSGAPTNATYRIATPNRGVRRVQDHGSCYYDGSGEPLAIAGYLLDVTDEDAADNRTTLQRLCGELERARVDAHDLNLVTYLVDLLILEMETRKR